MRRFFSSVLLLSYTGLFLFSPFASAQVAKGAFDLIIPDTARVNEAIDVTVKALKPDASTNTTYEGSISFDIDKDPTSVTLPCYIMAVPSSETNSLNTCAFQLSDQGEKKFPVSFTFSKPGTYQVTVIEDVEPYAEVSKSIIITDGGAPSTLAETVTITDPVSQMTLSENTVTVRGTSKVTSSINISVNGTKQASTTTNTQGSFESPVTLSAEGDNIIKVDVLNGTSAIIGTASVTVRYSLDAPKIDSLVVKEGNQVFAGAVINLEAVGDPGLKTVTVKFGGQTVVLEEDPTHLGIYRGTATVTSFEGEIKPVVSAESFTGGRADFPNLYNINVITAEFENVKVEGTPDNKARFTFSLAPDLDEIKYFKIRYGNISGAPDKNVITYEKSQMKEGNQYTWYIPDVSNGEYFATIIGLDKDKKELSIKSDEQTFAILNAEGTCYIDKVSGVTIKKSGSYSLITWDKLADAASYQIFKKDTSGEYAMIDEVTDNSYKVNIDMTAEKEVYEDFQIRATCKNGEIIGEGDYSESVSVQTGPVAIMFMIFMIASGTAFILMRRGYLK